MWNLTALDTSATTNRRSYFHSAVTRKASSTARETALSPTLELLSTRVGAPPARPHPTLRTPPHPALHAPSHRRATRPITPPRHAPHHTAAPRTPPHPRITPPPHTLPHQHHPQSRMQFPHGTNRRTLKNRGISTIRLQNLKHSQGNCMRNCCARGRQGPADHTPPSPYQSRT